MSKDLERLLKTRTVARYILMSIGSISGIVMILIPNEWRTEELTTCFLIIAIQVIFFSFFNEWAGDICTARQIQMDEEDHQARQDQLKRMMDDPR